MIQGGLRSSGLGVPGVPSRGQLLKFLVATPEVSVSSVLVGVSVSGVEREVWTQDSPTGTTFRR